MSKQVDERVVEMRFDNKQFESATKESMSTLDKLKQKLQLKDATKGLGDLEKAAKKVDLNPLGKAAETVSIKLSAMQVAGTTAIANITNSAINAGKKITKALTIEPITTGFQEYETQIGAIQTILANTQKEGTNVERVNAALDELNTYADQTIYNFTEMTRNIGTFTAAGVKLDDSVSAIKGIANLAAVSGSTSQQASTAMYQLSQALAAGKVSLMDWNSVVNAGMGGQVFQDALIRTSENLKTGAKQAIATYGTFRESLTKGEWLTKEVLTETLGQLAGAYSEADLLAKGYSEEQAKEIVKLAETAKSAATDVKTFTQLWDTLKEAVQSGWGQTWRMIVGDFDEAKERMSKLSKLFGDIIEKASNRRNSMLSGALESSWSKLTKKLNNAGIETETFQNKIIELAKTHDVNLNEMIEKEGSFEKALKKAFSTGKLDKSILMDAIKSFTGGIIESANAANKASNQMEKYGEIVDKVIRGDFGNGEERIKKLTEAGYEYTTVQNLVNKKLGSSVKHLSSLTDEQIKNADSLANLSDEQLLSKGYTEEQIIALKDLKKAADDSNSSIYKLINGFEKPSGKDLAWGSLFNIIDSITESLKAVKSAWTEIFHPGMSEDQIISERSERLYKLLESVHAFTESLKINENTADKITRTFKGLFIVLDILRLLISGTFGIAFRVLKKILSSFDLSILDVTASLGDVIVKFRDWIDSLLDFNKIFEPISKLVKGFITVIRDWFDEFKHTEEVQNLTKKIKEFGSAIKMDGSSADNFKKITEGLSELFIKLSYVLNASLLSGLKVLGAVLNLFGTNLANVAANLIDYLAKSKIWVNENILIANTIDEVAMIIKALIDGIKNCVKAFISLEPVQKIIENFKNTFSGLSDIISKIFSGFGVGNFANGITKLFKSLQDWIETLNNSNNIGRDIVLGLLNGLKSGIGTVISFIIELGKNILEAIKTVLGIHSPSTKFFEVGKNIIAGLINGIKEGASSLLSLIGNMGKKFVEIISSIDFSKLFTLAISAGIIYSGKKIYDLIEKFATPLEGLGKMFGGIGSMFSGLGKVLTEFSKTLKVKRFEIISKSILNFAISIGVLAASIYVLSNIEPAKLWTAVGAIGALAAIMVAMAYAMSKMSGASATIGKDGVKITGIKTALIAIGVSLLLIAATVKMLGSIDPEQAKQGFIGLAGIVGAIGIVLLAFGTFVKGKSAQNIDKFGKTLLKMSMAILLMVVVIKLISGMSVEDIAKGVTCIAAFGGIIIGLVALTNLAGKKIDKVGGTLLKMSAAMLLMVAVIKLVAGISLSDVIKGLVCITAFGGIMVGLVALSKLAGGNTIDKVGGAILKMSAAMALMALTIKFVAGMSLSDITKGIVCITAFGGIIAGLVAATKLAGEGELKKVASTILAMSVSIGILAAISVLLGLVDIKTLAKGITAVSILGAIMALMVAATRGAKDVKGNIIAMTVAIGIMAASVVALSLIDPSKLAGATIALSLLIGMFGLMGKIEGSAQASIGSLIVMSIAVGLLAGIILLLSKLSIESVLGSATALSVLLLSMSASLVILQKVGKNVGDALTGILGLLALTVPLVAFVGVLALMSNVKNATTNAIALSTFTVVMTAVLGALTFIGTFGTAAIIGVGSLLALSVPLVAFVGVLASMKGIQNAEKNAVVLGTFTVVMTGVLAALTLIGTLGPAAIIGVGSLVTLVVALTTLTVALGALNEKFPQLETFLSSGISLLNQLANGLGQVIGNFVSGFAQGFTSGLPEIATNLSMFMTNLVPFIEVAKMIDESLVTNVRSLASLILILTGAGIIDAVTSWLTGGNQIVDFGKQLVEFGPYIKAFADSVTGINESAVTAAANAGKMIAEMAKSLPNSGGIAGFFTGDNDIDKFGSKLVPFGEYIADFSKVVDGKVSESSVTAAVNAGKLLSELAASLPNSGGIAGFFAGNNDMDTFGSKLVEFGEGIVDFSESVSGKISGVDSAVASIKKLVSMLKDISGVNADAISSFKKSISNLGKTSIDKFVKSFNDSDAKAKAAINKFLKTISSSITSGKKTLYTKFSGAGKHLVNGFVKGIDENTFKAEAKAKVMALKALEAAKKALDEHSPSKKFMKVGAFVVSGFANGISKNVGEVNKTSVKMANGVLEATQDALGIHSPSIVFDKKVGRYIVQGIAEGITKDMSAEEAAEKKAQNIISAFRNVIDRSNLAISNRDKEFELWKLTDGKIASDVMIAEKQRKKLNDDLWEHNQQVKFTTDKWIELKNNFGENSKYAEEARGEMLDAQIKASETASELIALDRSTIINQEESIKDWSTINNNGLKILELAQANGELISDANKDKQYLEVYKDDIKGKKTVFENAKKYYEDMLTQYGDMSNSQVIAAKIAMQEAEENMWEAQSILREYEDSIVDREVENIKDNMSRREAIERRWEALNDDASKDQRYSFYKNMYTLDANDLWNIYRTYLDKYNKFVKDLAEKNNITIQEAKQTKEASDLYDNTLYPAYLDAIESDKKVRDLTKDHLEQQKEDLKNQYELTSDIADLKYQIWEKTSGRKATDTEKDTMKLAFLTEQLGAQAKLVEMAKKEWDKATDEDKYTKEKEYYSAQLELANLQSEVLDIQEANTKRQERALDRQRNAQTEYDNYLKKYEKYYLEHGMTLEELEKDAKLVSGYDPNNAVNSMISKTSNALNNLKSNSQYSGILSNFSDMGTTYASSVSEGIQNGISTVTDTTTTMLKSCVEVIDSKKESWTKAGVSLVNAFIEGIKSKINDAVNATIELASRALNTIQSICDSDMDYNPRITPVLDMSNVSAGVSQLNSMLNGKTTFGLASSIAKRTNSSNSTGSSSSQTYAPVYEFTQNNYSPKSLSSVEIYRQTKNMFTTIRKKG